MEFIILIRAEKKQQKTTTIVCCRRRTVLINAGTRRDNRRAEFSEIHGGSNELILRIFSFIINIHVMCILLLTRRERLRNESVSRLRVNIGSGSLDSRDHWE